MNIMYTPTSNIDKNRSASASPATSAPLRDTRDTRDGCTELYIGNYEYTRADITKKKITYHCSF